MTTPSSVSIEYQLIPLMRDQEMHNVLLSVLSTVHSVGLHLERSLENDQENRWPIVRLR